MLLEHQDFKNYALYLTPTQNCENIRIQGSIFNVYFWHVVTYWDWRLWIINSLFHWS